MPEKTPLKLRGLKGLNQLSNSEYAKWKKENAKYLGKYSSYKKEEELYNTQRFVNTYGKEAAKRLTYTQRLAVEQQDINRYNDAIRDKAFSDRYDCRREDGTVDPNKGMGNLDTFYKYSLMEPIFKDELRMSDWKTPSEMDNYVKEKQKKKYEELFNPKASFFNPKSYDQELKSLSLHTYEAVGKYADEQLDRGGNQNIIDRIYAKDMAFKANKVKSEVNTAYNDIKKKFNDQQVKEAFIKEIFPVKGKNAGIPQLAAFFDKKGNARSDEVEELAMDIDSMRMWLAKKKVYESKYQIGTAYDMLDKEAKDYIDEHQDWIEYSAALGKDLTIGATAYTMDKLNSIRAAYIQATEGSKTVKGYVDANGHYWGKEHLAKDKNGNYITDKAGRCIYVDPYSGEKIPVKEVDVQPSVLDAQGIAPDGTTRGAFFSNKYWSDAESTGMFDRKEQALAKSLNGYSPSKAVYKLGEEKDYFWEVAKMTQFALADAAAAGIPVLGETVGTAMAGSRVAQGVSAVSKATKAAGTALAYTGRFAQSFNATLGAAGIGHAYGRGVQSETLEGNMLMLNEKLYKDAEEEYHNNYQNNESFKKLIDSRVNTYFNDYVENNKRYIDSLPEDEKSMFLSDVLSDIKREVAQDFIEGTVVSEKDTEDYYNKVVKAADSATSAAATAAWTTGVKYFFVNNFGYRKFLFKNPAKRATSESQKFINKATEGADKKLAFKQKFANATRSEKLKEVGKVAASQMWGGAWTNFTDELQSAGARKINQDRMGKFLNDDYQAGAEAELFSSMSAISSYFSGAKDALFEGNTWNAGLVGALGSVTSVAPNMLNLTNIGNLRNQWKAIDANTKLSTTERLLRKTNLLVTNGILNTYFDKVLGEEQAKTAIDAVNKIIDDYDGFKALGRGLAIDLAAMDATNPHDQDAISFVQAAQIAEALYRFSQEEGANSDLMLAAQRSSLFNNALSTVQKLAPSKEGSIFSKLLNKLGINKKDAKFTEDDARQYLTEYYAKNPKTPQSEENTVTALKIITENAEKLKKGIEVFSTVNDIISKTEKESGKKVPLNVRSRLLERFALDQFLTDRIEEIEESITGSRTVTANKTPESYGNEAAINKKINSIDKIMKSLSLEIEKAKKDRDEKVKKAKDYSEERDNNLTSKESEEYGKLKAEADAAELQLKALEESNRTLSLDKDYLLSIKDAEKRVLTSEEILALSPEDRARMLDETNFDDFSDAQKEEITKAKVELNLRDPKYLNDIQQQAFMMQRRRVNSNAYSTMLENPEAAAAQIDGNSEARYRKYKEAIRRRRENLIESFFKNIEETIILGKDGKPENTEELEAYIISNLMTFPLNGGVDILKELRESEVPIIHKYKHLFDKAIFKLEILKDVKDTIDNIETEITDVKRDNLFTLIKNITNRSNTKEDLINELADKIDPDKNPGLTDQDRELISSIKNSLEEIWGQQSSTTEITKEEKEDAQEKLKKEQEAEEAARLEAEAAAAEEAIKEGQSPISKEDMDPSNEIEAERKINGLTDEDFKDNNEETLSEEEIKRGVEKGEDVDFTSPSIEEQAAKDPDNITVTQVSTDNNIDQANPDTEVIDEFVGNTFYEYDLNDLKSKGIQRKRSGEEVDDIMNTIFNWLNNAGIKLQDIIDTELGEILKSDPKVYPMLTDMRSNATNDKSVSKTIFLTVEYTNNVQNIHNNDLGGVISFNGKKYLIVGILGPQKGNKVQKDEIFNIMKEMQIKRKQAFDANPSERFFVDTGIHTKITRLTAGHKVRQLTTDSGIKVRKITELLNDKERNPKSLTFEDLGWGIQCERDFAIINVQGNKRVYFPKDIPSNLGATFLLLEGANGDYIPIFIRPLRYTEIEEKSRLKEQVEKDLSELTSIDYNIRAAALNKLVEYIYFPKEGIHLEITKEEPIIKIVDGAFGRNVVIGTYDLRISDDRIGFLEYIKELNPRVNLTASNLSNTYSLELLDEAGALTTDIAKLGTSGASYNVYKIDSDGNPIITEQAENPIVISSGIDLDIQRKKLNSEQVGTKTYRKDNEGNWYDETDALVTDQRLIEQLNYKNIIRSRNLIPNKVTGNDEIFIVNRDKDNPLVLVRRKKDYIFPMTKDGAIKAINEIDAEILEKKRQQKLKEEMEKEDRVPEGMSEEDVLGAIDKGKDVDLDSETLTPEQINDQLGGNFGTPPVKQGGNIGLGESGHTGLYNTKDVYAPAVKAGLLEEGTAPVGVIQARNSSDNNYNLSAVQAKLIMKKVESVLSDPTKDKTSMHDAVASDTHNIKAHVTVLDFLYNLQDKVYNGEVTVKEAMDMVFNLLQMNISDKSKLNEDLLKSHIRDIEKAKEILPKVEAALESTDIKLWSEDYTDNVNTSFWKNKDGGKTYVDTETNTPELIDLLQGPVGAIQDMSSIGKVGIVYRDQNGNTYCEALDTKDGDSISFIIFKDNDGNPIPLYFYKTLDLTVRDIIINNIDGLIKQGKDSNQIMKQANNLLSHSDSNLIYLKYRDQNKLAELRALASETIEDPILTDDTEITDEKEGLNNTGTKEGPFKPTESKEDINKTGNKSLMELQSETQPTTANSIICSKEFGDRALDLLESKFPDMPGNLSEINSFLEKKEIATTGITDVEQWLKMIEECK